MLQIAKRAGVIGHRRVVDSTGISDSVVTQDTVTLIRTAARRCLVRLAVIDPAQGARLRARCARWDYDEAGKPQISWSSPAARAELVDELFSDATTIIETCSAVVDDELGEHVELLRVVAAQDIEVVDSGDGPTAQIRQGVNRRGGHGGNDAHAGRLDRPWRSCDPVLYKLHVSTDIDSDLITAIEATTATTATPPSWTLCSTLTRCRR